VLRRGNAGPKKRLLFYCDIIYKRDMYLKMRFILIFQEKRKSCSFHFLSFAQINFDFERKKKPFFVGIPPYLIT
jgi:hypothetical protein